MGKTTLLVFVVLNVALSCNGLKKTAGYYSKAYVMPEVCRGLGFCKEKGRYYPTEVVDMVLRKVHKIQHRIGKEIEGYESRVHDSPLNPECDTNEVKYGPLYYILDQRNKTRVVIQSDKFDFWQKYEIRWCEKEGRVFNTLNFKRTALDRVNMTCRNVKTTLNFQVLTSNKLDMELVSVEMPVFCKARYDLLTS